MRGLPFYGVIPVLVFANCLTPIYAAPPRITLIPLGTSLTIEIEVEGLEGRISLTVPELINDSTRRLVYMETNLKTVQWKRLPDNAITSSWRQNGLASYEITTSPEANGVRIDWKFTNLSKEPWPDASGNICMRSLGLPTVFDPEGARTFLRKDHRWHVVRDTRAGQGSYWYLPPGMEPVDIMRPHLANGGWKIAPFHPDEALIAVQSKDKEWVIGQGWKRARYLIANSRSTTPARKRPRPSATSPRGRQSKLQARSTSCGRVSIAWRPLMPPTFAPERSR